MSSCRNSYDSSDHASVLFRLYGSVWPKVLLPCVLNICVAISVIYLKEAKGVNLTISDRGHKFTSTIISFLLVTRCSITYSRYMEARTGVAACMKACRELMQHAVTFTRYAKYQHPIAARRAAKWRSDLARKTIALLRFVVSVLEFETAGTHAWKIPALTVREKRALRKAVGDDNQRAPMILAMFIRSTIASHVEYLETPLHVNQELKLYSTVSDFVQGYHHLMSLIDTPFPFPLVQMNQFFIIIWVFTLPLVLYRDEMDMASTILAVFFMTFAFLGLEFVSIELDDPFGDDPVDIDVLAKAQAIFEDVYSCIYDIDGYEPSQRLRTYFSVQEMHDSRSLPSMGNIWYTINSDPYTGTGTLPPPPPPHDTAVDSEEYISSSVRIVGEENLAFQTNANNHRNSSSNRSAHRESKRLHRRLPTEDALKMSMVKSPDAGDDKSKLMQQGYEDEISDIDVRNMNMHMHESMNTSWNRHGKMNSF